MYRDRKEATYLFAESLDLFLFELLAVVRRYSHDMW
jgi:hypothetical protein